eukprot:g28961.t1
MRNFRRPKFMSSPSLSDLGKSEQATLDERGTQQRRAGSNATWNSGQHGATAISGLLLKLETRESVSVLEHSEKFSIQNAVIAVFQRKGLPDNELYSLNEGV